MLDSISLPHLERGRVRPTVPAPSSFSGLPTKPSAPIQIPAGRRQPTVYQTPSVMQTVSPPDTIFEMSPVISEFAGRHHQHSFALAQPERRSPDSFLYNVPAFSPRPSQSISDQLYPSPSDRTTLSCLNKRYRATDPLSTRRSPAPPKPSSALDEYDLFPVPFSADGASEMSDSLHYTRKHEPVGLGRLSPGPRQASYSSPWILPGRGEGSEEDVAYSQKDPSTLEYQRHLLQRIESQNPSRILNMRSYM